MRIKTFVTRPADIDRRWWLVDAEGQTLGRLASQIAPILRGKHKPTYSPHLDTGDYIVLINCDKMVVSGNRLETKKYYHHTGYPGGIKEITLRRTMETHPDRAIQAAVRGMLPRGPLGRHMLKKLKIYAGSEHPHAPQSPEPLKLEAK